jgi:hypothetical protein
MKKGVKDTPTECVQLAFQIPLEGLWKIEKSRNSLKVLRVMYIVLGSA